MTVLIDQPLWPAHGTMFCHLVSDSSLIELHAFASLNRIPPRAFDLDHYDIPQSRRDELVLAGAIQVTGRQLVLRLRASGLRVRGKDRPASRA